MSNNILSRRIPMELKNLKDSESVHRIKCTTIVKDNFSQLLATVPGPKGSPYELGSFQINISFGDQYPFQPPIFKFLSPVFHPNIDNAGNICLDLLRIPPTGSYNPSLTLESLLLSIQLLLANPNPDDPLQLEAAELFKTNREEFNMKAKEHVLTHQKNESGKDELTEAATGGKSKSTALNKLTLK